MGHFLQKSFFHSKKNPRLPASFAKLKRVQPEVKSAYNAKYLRIINAHQEPTTDVIAPFFIRFGHGLERPIKQTPWRRSARPDQAKDIGF